ncbi:MAG: hypothetical protein ACRDIY_08340 [Chloroflexota bacterium]
MSAKAAYGHGDPRMTRAIEELEALVLDRYPTASFEVAEGDDPAGTYLWTTVDVVDTDEVMDLVIDHLLDLQVEQRLPVYFVPIPAVEPGDRGSSPGRENTLPAGQTPYPSLGGNHGIRYLHRDD